MKRASPLHRFFALLLLASLCGAAAHAQTVSQLQVSVATGAVDLAPGSFVELRIYRAHKDVLRLPLTHGEGWPRDSTRVIPVKLTEPLDTRSVLRFGLYYRAANAQSPPWEVLAADVDLSAGRQPPELLLGATLTGSIDKQGELATAERDVSTLLCISDSDCDDHLSCNGRERCAPRAPGADARGCVHGAPVSCPVNQVCIEGHGCAGASSLTPTRK